MAGTAARTSAVFDSGVTTVEIVDSDNDDISVGDAKSGVRKSWVPSIDRIRQVFTSSPPATAVSGNSKRLWRRRPDKQDAGDGDQYCQQDDERDDYGDDNEDPRRRIDDTAGRDVDNDENDDDDDDDDDEDREMRKIMLKKPNKKEIEVKKPSKCAEIDSCLSKRFILKFHIFRKH